MTEQTAKSSKFSPCKTNSDIEKSLTEMQANASVDKITSIMRIRNYMIEGEDSIYHGSPNSKRNSAHSSQIRTTPRSKSKSTKYTSSKQGQEHLLNTDSPNHTPTKDTKTPSNTVKDTNYPSVKLDDTVQELDSQIRDSKGEFNENTDDDILGCVGNEIGEITERSISIEDNHVSNNKSGSEDSHEAFSSSVSDNSKPQVPRAYSNFGQIQILSDKPSPRFLSQVNPNSTILYLDVRQYLTDLSHQIGKQATLDNIPPADFEKMSLFDIVWLIGVWQCELSPFAIMSYEEPAVEIDSFRKRLNSTNTLLMLDFVASHSARNANFDEELYVRDGPSRAADNGDFSTAKFDLQNVNTVKFQLQNVQKVCSHCDVVHCVSHKLAPQCFWEAAESAVPDTHFIYEIETTEPFEGPSVVQSGRSRNSTIKIIEKVFRPGYKVFGWLQINGFTGYYKLNSVEPISEPMNAKLEKFYTRLVKAVSQDAVKNGEMIPKTVKGSGVIKAWEWKSANQRILVTINDSDGMETGSVVCDDVEGEKEYEVYELLSDTIYTRSPGEMRTQGLGLILWEHLAQVFNY